MNKKVIWITGGSTGIGKALALKFANNGWTVAISARRENLLKEIIFLTYTLAVFYQNYEIQILLNILNEKKNILLGTIY